ILMPNWVVLLHLCRRWLIAVGEKKWFYVFPRQTHRLLRLLANRRKLSREEPGASARIEHRRAVGHAPGHGAVGCADAFGATLLREADGYRRACRRSDRTGPGAASRPGPGVWPLVGSLAVGGRHPTSPGGAPLRIRRRTGHLFDRDASVVRLGQ